MNEKYLGENSTPILINQIKDKLEENYKVMGQLGAKNLISYPYYTGKSYTTNGITFNVNDDGSVTLNGTSTSWTSFYLNRNKALKAGTYIVSSNPLPKNVYLTFKDLDNNINYNCTENVQSITLSFDEDFLCSIFFQTQPNVTLDNFVIYPMLRLADDTDDTWQPYAPTNRDLFLNKMNNVNPTGTGALSLNRKENTSIGVNSVAEGNACTASGNNSHAEGDNSKAIGLTSHAEGNYAVARGSFSHAEGRSDANGAYSHTQNYNTIAENHSQTAIGKNNDNKSTTLFEVGNGADANNRSNAFEVYSDGSLSTDNGTTKVKLEDVVNNINDIWKINGELGAKNLISLPFYNGTDTRNGVLWTDNGDSTLSFYGQIETGYTYSGYNIMRINTLKANTYILSMAKPFPTAYLEARLINNVGSMIKSYGKATPNNGGTLTFEITTEDEQHTINDNYRIGIIAMIDSSVLPSGDTADGVIYPMLRLASDTDPTWRPYAKTNYELTQDTDIPIVRGTGNNSIILNSPSTNTANGNFSVAEGSISSAGSDYSHAEGYYCRAQGQRSHAQNSGTVAQGYSQTAIGKYNVLQGTSTSNQDNDYALIIGNGTNTNNRSNALAVQWDGTVVMQDNSTIKSAKTVYEVMGKMGAKNLLKYPYCVNSAGYNGITYTAQKDGSIIANGTATGYSHIALNINISDIEVYTFRTLPQGKYILSLESNNEFTGSFSLLVRYKFTDGTPYIDNQVTINSSLHYNEKVFEITQEYAEKMQNNTMYLEIRVLTNDGSANNIILYPMIRLADNQDNTYQPYAMTNKELTDKINSLKTIVANSTDFASFKTAIANW